MKSDLIGNSLSHSVSRTSAKKICHSDVLRTLSVVKRKLLKSKDVMRCGCLRSGW